MSNEYDVAVVGAGAAGIAAGGTLRRRGAKYCVLEAKSRIGGRAWTDTSALDGMPVDLGCHWLHSASRNPLRKFADAMGIAYDATFSFEQIRYVACPERVTDRSPGAVKDAVEAGLALLHQAGRRGLDMSAADAVRSLELGELYPTFAHIVGLITSALPERLSAIDYARGDDTGGDYPVRDGLGALVCRLGEGLNVHRNTPVTNVDRTGDMLRITTDTGTLRARRLILTVSTSVLSSGCIRFAPALPAATTDALSACPLGRCEKVAFLMDRPLADVGDNSYLTLVDTDAANPVPVSLNMNPFGRPMVVVDLAGPYMAGIASDRPDALIDLATERMLDAFGTDMRKRILKSVATQWSHDPHVGGAYSYVIPGHASARELIAQPIDDRLFIAGEAASPSAFASCHGAYESGAAAATMALAGLRPPVLPTRAGQ